MSVPVLECEMKRRKCPERDIPWSALRLIWCVRSISRTRTGLGAPRNDEVKGKIKEMAGQRTNDLDLEGKGIAEKTAGKVQNKAGHAEKAIGN
jgi:uncharacterized protein YjbJ (UPF0337 family)